MRLIHAAAPIRICDVGGWTDTWFAGHGRVLNIAVSPYAEVRLRVAAGPSRSVRVQADDVGAAYDVVPGERASAGVPIVDAAIALLPPPAGVGCELTIRCAVPAGASTGTSAAVTVALVGALARLRGHDLAPGEAAELAYAVETEHLGRQSGVQDQIAAAFGGVNAIAIAAFPERMAFPSVTVTPLDLAAPVRAALEHRLILVYLGQGHESSAIHEAVIQALADAGPEAPPLVRLRQAALDATDALQAGDLGRFGAALQRNTDAQADLHPMLVSDQVRRLMAVAREHGAAGWKVNGAGGDGGTLTLLSGERPADRAALVAALAANDPRIRLIPIALDRDGLRVREVPAEPRP